LRVMSSTVGRPFIKAVSAPVGVRIRDAILVFNVL